MMSKSTIIPASAALLLTLLGVGCSKQQAVQSPAEGNFPVDHVIRVAPQVAATKGSYTTDKLTKFDLLVEDSNNLTSKYTYNLTVGKDKVEAGDITVSEWGSTVDLNGEGGEQDVDA